LGARLREVHRAPAAVGTQLLFTVHGRPTGMMRLAQPLLRRTLKHQFAGYCETLKQVLENQTRIVR
jgi:hypothetical protein